MTAKVYQTGIDTYFNDIYIENAIININETITLFDRLINNNNLLFDEYIDIINKIYNVTITNNDLFRISSLILGDTAKSVILNTDMMCDIIKAIELNKKIEYECELRYLDINVAFTDDSAIKFRHRYSAKEIKKLIDGKKIVLLDFIVDDDDLYDCDNKEYYGLYPLSNITYNSFTNLKHIRKDYIPAINTFLNNYFTTERLKKDLSLYLKVTRDKLMVVENRINDILKGYSLKEEEYRTIINDLVKIREKSKDV